MISNKRTPKLKTSDFTENKPSIAYSGAMYPLLKINVTVNFINLMLQVNSAREKGWKIRCDAIWQFIVTY